MNSKKVIVALVLLMGIAVLGYFLSRKSEPLTERPLTELAAEFYKIVPEDVPDSQRSEIKGLLKRFQAKASAGRVRAEDYAEVMSLFSHYLERGDITREELNIVMAKVGYYSYREFSPDSSDIHPLLEPVEAPRDTTLRRHKHD